MTMDFKITSYTSLGTRPKKPVLSILVPYYRDNPIPLIQALGEQCVDSPDVEILVYDDGTNNAELNCAAIAAVKNCEAPVSLFIASENRGRSFARNSLTEYARGKWVLFLDADMRPETENFVSNYLASIQEDAADVIFGGFTVPAKSNDPDRELHRALSEISDCLSLEDRIAAGPQFVASSNLAVRKNVLDVEPFDPEFMGWGWEDSEWAARISKNYTLIHTDNPALHLGLETTDTLLRRFRTSGPNYLRFTQKHPDLAKTLPLYRIVQKMKHVPGQKISRPILRLMVKQKLTPVSLRIKALKLWRASWYAETFA